MKKRTWSGALILLAGFLFFTGCKPGHLNLLIVHTDQQARWTVGVYNEDELRGPLTTPNLDRLAKEGILFTNFFTNSAVCSPSRALMMTGCYATRNGVVDNNMVMVDLPTLADHLAAAGYKTGYAGKWHLSGTARPGWAPDPYGWVDNRYMFNRGHYKMIRMDASGNPEAISGQQPGDEESYTTDWLTDRAIEFIRGHQDDLFAYMVSYPDPHQPWQVREPFNSMYDPDMMSVPRSFFQTIDPLNNWHREMVEQYGILTAERLQRIKSMYSGSVNLIDYNVGIMLAELEQLDLLDQTMIVFTTDHGEYMGEHGLLYKNVFFEAAYRLPLIIRHPDMEAGQFNPHFIGMVDFMPGILSLLGLPVPEEIDGRDFALTFHEDPDWNEEVIIHHSRHDGAGLYTPDYFLLLHRTGEDLLFDRIRDPEALHNIYYDPESRFIADSLSARIISHHRDLQTGEWVWLQERN